MPQSKITLTRAIPSDVPNLASIFTSAFLTDTHTALKTASQPPGTQEQGMAEGLTHWISSTSGRVVLLKAEIEGVVLGWACWSWSGIDVDIDAHLGERIVSADEVKAVSEQTTAASERELIIAEAIKVADRSAPPASASLSSTASGLDILEAITNADMSSWAEKFAPSPETKCMILVAIAVAPSAQGQGVGSALMNWGLNIADQENVFTWVSASDGGWGHFQRRGFQLCGGLKARLDDFADGVVNEDGREWGWYTWRFGKRLPVVRA